MNEDLLKKEAAQFRQECGFNNSEPIRLKSLLQKRGVLTVFKPLSDAFSGMALKVARPGGDDFWRFMLVNSNQSLGKQHFTICHELYHLCVQAQFTSQVSYTGKFDKKADPVEYQADVFASYLLLPEDGLLRHVPDDELRAGRVTLRTLLYIEQLYSCSRRVLVRRLREMKFIHKEDEESFLRNVRRSAWEHGYSTSLYEPGNKDVVIGGYGSLARTLYDKETISQSHYYGLLHDLGVDFSSLETPDDEADYLD